MIRRYRADNRLDTTEYRITTDNAHLTTPLTIALITDLHDRPCERLLTFLADCQPDFIAIAGDLVDGYAVNERSDIKRDALTRIPRDIIADSAHILPFLTACIALAPAYCSLGNHEWLLSDDDLVLIRDTGVHLLDNESAEFPLDESTAEKKRKILIGGLTSSSVMRYREYIRQHPDMADYYPLPELRPWWKRKRNTHPHLDYEWLEAFEQQDAFKILLCHHPEYWRHKDPVLSELNIDLTLSGHAHGGQIRIFRHGIFAPGQGLLPKYTDGVHHGKYGKLVVSRGLANTAWIPRFGNCPEVVVIRLFPSADSTHPDPAPAAAAV